MDDDMNLVRLRIDVTPHHRSGTFAPVRADTVWVDVEVRSWTIEDEGLTLLLARPKTQFRGSDTT